MQWSADQGSCENSDHSPLFVPPVKSTCDPKSNLSPASNALTNYVLYRQMVDTWSMRNWQLSGQSGHDHFFDAFGKFSAATWGQTGPMLAGLVAHAARGRVLYVEVLLTPDGGAASALAQEAVWDGDFAAT